MNIGDFDPFHAWTTASIPLTIPVHLCHRDVYYGNNDLETSFSLMKTLSQYLSISGRETHAYI